MATTTATVSISSADLTPGMALNINASSSLMKSGTTTGLEIMDMGRGELKVTDGPNALQDVTATSGDYGQASYVYICNNSTDDQQYIKVGIHNTVIGNLGAGDWCFFPWSQGDVSAELNIEAEATGTIPYEYAIFKSEYELAAKS